MCVCVCVHAYRHVALNKNNSKVQALVNSKELATRPVRDAVQAPNSLVVLY